MSENRAATDQRTLIAIRAERHSTDTQLVLRVLARMGLGPEVIEDYDRLAIQEILDGPRVYIDSIINPEQFMGREHFVTYRDVYANGFNISVAAKAFRLATTQGVTQGLRDIAIEPRDRAGLGPIPDEYSPSGGTGVMGDRRIVQDALLAVQAGSVVELGDFFGKSSDMLPKGVGIQTISFMQQLSHFLQDRFEPQPATLDSK